MDNREPPRIRKKRIPKACGTCRRSKAKCDGKRPCSRCHDLNKVCTFTDPPKEAHQVRIEELEEEVAALRVRLGESPSGEVAHDSTISRSNISAAVFDQQSSVFPGPKGGPSTQAPSRLDPPLPISAVAADHSPSDGCNPLPVRLSHAESPTASVSSSLRKRSHFEIGAIGLPDCIDAGLLTPEQAESYFAAFFQGCDHYVPVFDPRYDSILSIRARSSLLFSAICTVGCRVITGTDAHQWRLLDFHVKRMLNCALATPAMASLETIQALLVRSCYASERSLLVAAATRMAVDLGFPESYDELIAHSAVPAGRGVPSAGADERLSALMRKTRTWLHLFVLGHILYVDAADLPTLKFVGDARRSRIALKNPASTELDLFLISQVELNVIRSRIYDSLSNPVNAEDGEIFDVVREAKIDIGMWFDDWSHIFEKREAQSPWLVVNLRVQKCWAENMAMCRAVRASGVENVDFMSSTQRTILSMARDALEEHLDIMIEEPRSYLHNLRFAMDFVWAKCEFCYLLLLKLSILLPESHGRSSQDLVAHGSILLTELGEAGDGTLGSSRSNTGKLYLQLLQTGIEKFSNTLQEGYNAGTDVTSSDAILHPRRTFGAVFGEQAESGLDSFVPEQFVFEWDFPGLTLFSSSATAVAWLDDILLETLNGGEDVFGWGSMDSGD